MRCILFSFDFFANHANGNRWVFSGRKIVSIRLRIHAPKDGRELFGDKTEMRRNWEKARMPHCLIFLVSSRTSAVCLRFGRKEDAVQQFRMAITLPCNSRDIGAIPASTSRLLRWFVIIMIIILLYTTTPLYCDPRERPSASNSDRASSLHIAQLWLLVSYDCQLSWKVRVRLIGLMAIFADSQEMDGFSFYCFEENDWREIWLKISPKNVKLFFKKVVRWGYGNPAM